MSLGGLIETEHICQLTNFITNSQLSKLFIEHILMNLLMWIIGVRFSWNFQLPPASRQLFGNYFNVDKKFSHRRKHLFFYSKRS